MTSVHFSEMQTNPHLLFRGQTFTQKHVLYYKSALRSTPNPPRAAFYRNFCKDHRVVVYQGLALTSGYLLQDVKAIRLHTCCRAGLHSAQRNKQTGLRPSGQVPVFSASVWRRQLAQQIVLPWINDAETESQRQKPSSSDVSPRPAFTFDACNP